MTPRQLADDLRATYRGAARMEMLTRYHWPTETCDLKLYRQVLVLLGAGDLIARKPTPRAVAEAFAEHIEDPAPKVAMRALSAGAAGDVGRQRFWSAVVREIGPRPPAFANDP